MKVVIKLGGVNGSGKTTVATALLKEIKPTVHDVVLPATGKATQIHKGSWGGKRVWVLGKYDTACGGMDTISDKHDRYQLVEEVVRAKGKTAPDIVFFEGLITGKTYGALGELSEAHHAFGEARWLYAFMDTPFDVAVQRVLTRRATAGNSAPFDPERTMRPTYDSCTRLESYLRGTAVGRVDIRVDHPVLTLKHQQRPATLAKQVLRKAEEIHDAGF